MDRQILQKLIFTWEEANNLNLNCGSRDYLSQHVRNLPRSKSERMHFYFYCIVCAPIKSVRVKVPPPFYLSQYRRWSFSGAARGEGFTWNSRPQWSMIALTEDWNHRSSINSAHILVVTGKKSKGWRENLFHLENYKIKSGKYSDQNGVEGTLRFFLILSCMRQLTFYISHCTVPVLQYLPQIAERCSAFEYWKNYESFFHLLLLCSPARSQTTG